MGLSGQQLESESALDPSPLLCSQLPTLSRAITRQGTGETLDPRVQSGRDAGAAQGDSGWGVKMQKSLKGALTRSCQRSPGQTTGTKPWAREADPWTQSEWRLKPLNPSIREVTVSSASMTKKEAQYVTGFSVLEKEMHAFLVKCMPFQSENEAHTGVGLAPGISVLQEGQQLVGNLSHFTTWSKVATGQQGLH